MKADDETIGMLRPTEWLDKHGDYLFSYALRRVRNTAVAEDLLQETLLAAIGASDRHEGRSSERTWLTAILKHKIIDYFRRVSRTPESQLAENVDLREPDYFEATGPWRGHWREDLAPTNWPVDAASLLESREFCETFDRCLLFLPSQMAMAFTLREIDGLSTDEICEILQISPNNLWVILHRARAKLRQLLEVEWFGGDGNTAPPVRDENATKTLQTAVRSEFSYRAVAA